MSVIASVQDAIIGQIRQAVPDLAAEPFPQKPQEYELLHPEGAALVQYGGSRFLDAGISGAAARERIVSFTICVLVRGLSGSSGCYAKLADISNALSGFRPQGCREGGKLIAERFLFENDGVWAYVQSYEYKLREVFPDHT